MKIINMLQLSAFILQGKGKVLCVFFFFVIPFEIFAQGNLLVTPRRIVFEGKKQREEITLANTGKDTAFYSISFLQYYMTKEGSFEEITEPRQGQLFADSYLRYFPRSVEIAPGESQVVRMQVRPRPGMTDGEYRSHLYFRAIPKEKPLGEDDAASDSTVIGIKLTPIFGISIPVIIRYGKVDFKVSINNLALEKQENGTLALKIELDRNGNRSTYGDLSVDYIAPGVEKTNVGMIRGIAVYTPNNERRIVLPLHITEGVDFKNGKLLVRYTSSNEARSKLYAEKELVLN